MSIFSSPHQQTQFRRTATNLVSRLIQHRCCAAATTAMTDPSSGSKNTMNHILKPAGAKTPPSSRLLRALFTSLAGEDSRRWTLTRHLRSDNPADLNGELRGIATFQPLPGSPTTSTTGGVGGSFKDLLYREEGEVPGTVVRGMAGLRWSKKYIWRLNCSDDVDDGDADATSAGDHTNLDSGNDGRAGISVWFVKVAASSSSGKDGSQQQQQQHDEADYLFHEFEFDGESGAADNLNPESEDVFVAAPTPPAAPSSTTASTTTILTARGNHLCVKDMYRTAYAFSIHPETGEVLSWASRHVVKGPKKNQEIVNWYQREREG